MIRASIRFLAAATLVLFAAAPALAQDDSDDAVFRPAEPDFTLIALPTGLPLPKYKSAFRVTHRFTRPLGSGDFGDFVEDGFGIDSGAQIGLEYRFGIVPHGQIGFYRTSNRTIELFAQYDVLPQGHTFPVDVSAFASIDGTNNFRGNGSKTPAIGAIVSRRIGEHAAVYAEPLWVNNSNPLPKEVVDHNNTFMVGLGARVRVRPSVYVVGEVTPRSGFKPGENQMAFAVEKHVGGHMFQLNFSNSFGSTIGQIAIGGPASKDWFMGFNITRKFF